MTNANQPTRVQIKNLRREALGRGDYYMVDVCDRATSDDTTDQDGNEIAFADWTREQALAAVREALAM